MELSTLTKNWLDAIYARQDYELKLAAQGGGGDTTIRIEGGLPQLPGTNVIFDETAIGRNGHASITNGHGTVIEHTEHTEHALATPFASEAQDA